MSPPVSRLRRALSRLAASPQELEAEELQEDTAQCGATPVAQLEDRRRAVVRGTVRTVTLRPRAGVPALEAELYDGSGTLSIVWLGRRQIRGIDPGRGMKAEGMVTTTGAGPVMFNPRYELLPAGR
ncbi:MAG: OB-fold nucleic acid binding domain-containing protein [Actinomycetota bacterium]|nr:OB-fold nucleic acid binding domain-containing protein [Actinomycetota bacterium]